MVWADPAPKRRLISLIVLGGLGLAGAVGADERQVIEQQKIPAAVKIADAWIAIIDSGDYLKALDRTTEAFKGIYSEQQWEAWLDNVRTPLEAVRERKRLSATYTTKLPGAPAGEYVVVEYETLFIRKYTAIEVVTPELQRDGTWKVSGYYIKDTP